ncbi:hypothetical protein V1504DRAFT_495592 [Lipomyces starkeyi]
MKTVPKPFIRAQSKKKHFASGSTARWTCKQCLDAVEKKEIARTKKDLRAAFLNKEAIDKMGQPWVLETAYDIRDAAMDGLLKAYDSAHARYKKDNKVFKI